jgi:putative tricarboxylic transport membrane protein
MRKFEYEPAPFIMAFVLSPIMEQSLRRSLILSDGDFGIFFSTPISLGCLILAGLLLILAALPAFRKRREKIVTEAEEME